MRGPRETQAESMIRRRLPHYREILDASGLEGLPITHIFQPKPFLTAWLARGRIWAALLEAGLSCRTIGACWPIDHASVFRGALWIPEKHLEKTLARVLYEVGRQPGLNQERIFQRIGSQRLPRAWVWRALELLVEAGKVHTRPTLSRILVKHYHAA